MDTKQIIVMRRDLVVRRGKEIAQGAHASMSFLTRRLQESEEHGFSKIEFSEAEKQWLDDGFRKITLQVPTIEDLLALRDRAADAGLEVQVIIDCGATEFHGEPTLTCMAIGPDWADKIDAITGELALY